MKKRILAFLILMFLLTSCTVDSSGNEDVSEQWGISSRYVYIIKDPEYGCEYVWISDTGFMPRLDKQGNVVCN